MSRLVWAGAILASVIVASVAAMALMFGVLSESREETVNAVGPMVDLRERPKGPILQVDPSKELVDMRRQNAEAADSYGWVNRKAGTVRIPVERAMKLVVERGIK